MDTLDFLVRLLIAFICGCAIGSERQIHHRTAGIRTNALVALGAAAFTMFDLMNHDQFGSDLRVSAQVVSGIGFIGGGAILKDGFNIRGMTTAATLWCSAAAGLLSASGYLWETIFLSLLVTLINTFMRPIVSMLDNVATDENEYVVKVSCDSANEDNVKNVILDYIETKKLNLKDIKIIKSANKKAHTEIYAVLLSKKDKKVEDIAHKIAKKSKIHAVMWEQVNSN